MAFTATPHHRSDMSRYRFMVPALTFLTVLLTAAIATGSSGKAILSPERMVRMDSKFAVAAMTHYIDFLEDPAKELTITDIAADTGAALFTAVESPNIDFGITKSVYWLRFTVSNTTPVTVHWFLEIAYPMLGELQLYIPAGKKFLVKKAGALIPFGQRDVNNPNIVFSVRQPPGMSTYYLRVHSPTSSLHLPITVCSPESFYKTTSRKNLISGIFYGILIVTLAYNLFLLLSIREQAYFYYVCYVVSFMVMHLAFDGLGYQFLWPHISRMNIPSFHIFIVNIALLLFTFYFLRVETYLPFLKKVIFSYSTILFLMFCINLLFPYHLTMISILTTFVTCLFLISTGIVIWRMGNRTAIFYLVSWLFLLSGATVRGMMAINLLPFTGMLENLFRFSAAAQVVLFSLALGDHINLMRKSLAGEVTKLKQAREEIKQSEKHYRSIIENMQDLVSQVDEKGIVHYASPSHATLLGYEHGNLTGKRIFELLHAEDYPLVVQSFRNAMEQKTSVSIEFRVRSSTGTYVWLESVATLIFNSKGEFDHFLIGSRDITARKEMELALASSEEKFSKAFHASPNMVFISSIQDGRYLEINDSFVNVLGYSRDEVIGRTSKELGIMKDQGDRNRIVSLLIEKGKIRHQEASILTKNQEERIGSFSADIIHIKGEQCLLTIVQDITERKQNEEERRRLQNLMADIIDSMPSAIIGVDRNLVVTNWNQKAELWLGIPDSDAKGQELPNLIPTLIEDFSILKETIQNSNIHTFETTRLGEGENSRAIDITIYPLKREEMAGAVIRIDDVTERIMMEEERQQLREDLRHAQKMESLGTLAGGIAHDFNNILSAVLGYAQLARLNNPDFSHTEEYIHKIEKAGVRAKKLVEQILSFSRQQKGEKQVLDIGIVLKEALGLLRASLPATIEIRQDVRTGMGLVMADPTQVHQIIMNICTNAFHAMRENGGILTVSLTVADAVPDHPEQADAERRYKRYMLLTIADTGCGIDEAVQKRMFEPYFTTKEIGVGTGLGLSVVKGIVETHGGFIQLESQVGQGTVFHIYLPRLEKHADEARETKIEIPRGTGRILFVDDEKFVTEMGKEMLTRLGYQVDIENDPVKAFSVFTGDPSRYDVVITDMTMPSMTGDTLTEKIHALRPGIPVIICTGYNSRLFPEKMQGNNSNEVLLKPYTIAELAQAVHRARS